MSDAAILVVEDEQSIASLVTLYLSNEGFRVTHITDGALALDMIERAKPDLVILDLMLPGMDGVEICRRLRASNDHVPVVMLTARDAEVDRILGLELGADDYITKPFGMQELVARIRAVLRRVASSGAAPPDEVYRLADLSLNRDTRSVAVGGHPVDLTPSEFELLATLLAAPGRVFSREVLLERLQGNDYEGVERTIDVHIRNLRKKIEPDPTQPRYIKTVFGVGYRTSAPAELGQ